MNLPLLLKLQDLHREMDDITVKLKKLYETEDLKKLKMEYQRLKGEYRKGEERLKGNTHKQEIRNNEIKNLDCNKLAYEKIKYSRETDTVKKLESIEKQLEKLKEKKQEAENDIIKLINEAEYINKELEETKKRMSFIKKKYLYSKEVNDKAIAELEEQKSKLSPKVDDLIIRIDKESLDIYTKLLKAHPDPVARVEDCKCSGCKMEVPAMDYEALKNGSQEMRCQNCGRLLYYCKY